MWKPLITKIGIQFMRGFSIGKQYNLKVCVCGASGGVGQPLSLILKTNPLVTELALYDLVHAPGIGVDISHINTFPPVKGFCGPENLKYALSCSDVVVLTAGKARKSGMTRADLFKSNANIIVPIVQLAAKICPKALIVLITNPVNSLIPVIAEVMKKANIYDPNRYFGVTTLDVVRARTFIAQHIAYDPQKVKVDVVGGHSDLTILPVLSNAEPRLALQTIDEEDVEKLTIRIQDAGKEVIEAKGGSGSATLSMAYSGGVFINALLMGLKGFDNAPVEVAYIASNVVPELEYFATPLRFGVNGMMENLGLPPLSTYEENLLKCLIPELKKDIEMGKDFAKTLNTDNN